MSTTAYGLPTETAHRRRHSTVELAGSNGNDVVDPSELNEEDQTLAQFGYKPVHTHQFLPLHFAFVAGQKVVSKTHFLHLPYDHQPLPCDFDCDCDRECAKP